MNYGLAHLSPPLADELLEALTTAQNLRAECLRAQEAWTAARDRYTTASQAHNAADRRLLALMKRAMVDILGPEAVAYYHQQLDVDPLGLRDDFADDEKPF